MFATPCTTSSQSPSPRTQPLLERLLAELQETHPQVDFPPLPQRGTLDLNAVRDAAYFFS